MLLSHHIIKKNPMQNKLSKYYVISRQYYININLAKIKARIYLVETSNSMYLDLIADTVACTY